MQRSLFLHGLLHLPALAFLLLAAGVFLLPQEKRLPPITAEITANDIAWQRITALGQVINLSTDHLQRQADGTVEAKDVKIEFAEQGAYLYGKHGITDTIYEKIRLTGASGELITPTGKRITLSMASALYYIDGTQLLGKSVNIHQHNDRLTGDTFHLDGSTMRLRGNVRASYYSQLESK